MTDMKLIQTLPLPVDGSGDPYSGIVTPIVDGEGNVTGFQAGVAVALSGGSTEATLLLVKEALAGISQDLTLTQLITAIRDALLRYRPTDYDDASDPKYFSFVDKNGNWFILKQDESAKSLRYATGASYYADNWINRSSLDFNYFYDIIIP